MTVTDGTACALPTVQWGFEQKTTIVYNTMVTYSIEFPTMCFGIFKGTCTADTGAGMDGSSFCVYSVTKSQGNIRYVSADRSAYWLAVGY